MWWCLLQCLLAKTVGIQSPGVGRSEECAQGFAPQSHIHSGLNQQDLVSSDVFFAPQWPVRRRKMVVWVLVSRVLIWSFCGSYPLFFNLQADFCFCFRRLLTSLYVVEKWGWGSFAAAFASLSAVSFSAMPTCSGTHWSTTLLLSDRVRKLSCSCWVRKSVGPFVRDWRADRESDNKTIFCWLQSSSIRSSVAAFRACTSAL